jgi:hypothetical protein
MDWRINRRDSQMSPEFPVLDGRGLLMLLFSYVIKTAATVLDDRKTRHQPAQWEAAVVQRGRGESHAT